MTQPQDQNLLHLAVGHHQAGRLAEAEGLYREILSRDPNHARALHLLGMIAGQQGRPGDAAQLIARAAALLPKDTFVLNDLSKFRRDAGDIAGAIVAAQSALQIQPDFAEAHNNLGLALGSGGQNEPALAAFERATQLKPDFAEALNNLGVACVAAGKLDQAIAALQRAVQLQPGYLRAWSNLSGALTEAGRLEDALRVCQHVINKYPLFAPSHIDLGNAQREMGQLPNAIDSFRRSIQLQNNSAPAYGNLAVALSEAGKFPEALSAFNRAIQLDPKLPEIHNNLGIFLCDTRNFEPAAQSFAQAIELRPDFADAHLNLAHVLLLKGDFARGLPEYEWRAHVGRQPIENFPRPRWRGEELGGKSILLRCDACGMGDTIQFCRYTALVAARGGRVILQCQPPLARLLRSCPGVTEVIPIGQSVPPFDVHIRLMSLLLIFGTDLGSIPSEIPYLKAEPDQVESWRRRFPGQTGIKKVGLVWSGESRKIFRFSRNRSMPLSQLAPLSQVPGVQLISLQKGDAAKEVHPWGSTLIDHTSELNDFADTAALMTNLDLIIAVDTAVAHVAGAMGKPAWVMLPFNSDWRWLSDRADSPWYPSMRLFRQATPGDWSVPVRQVADALAAL